MNSTRTPHNSYCVALSYLTFYQSMYRGSVVVLRNTGIFSDMFVRIGIL